MTRQRLPDRRPSVTECLSWQDGRRIHVTAGFAIEDSQAVVRELFLRGGGQVGSERDFLLDDVAVLISRLLQHGDGVAKLSAGVSRLPSGEPASVIGAALDLAARIERES